MSFRTGLKEFLSLHINSAISSINSTCRVTNDATQYMSGGKSIATNEIICQLSYGNEGRESYHDFTFMNGSISMIILVPYNDKEKFINMLDGLWSELSESYTRYTIDATLYASFNINSCSTDGISHIINGSQYCLISVIGTYTWTDTQIDSIYMDKVEISGNELKGIASIQYNNAPIINKINVIGSRFPKNVVLGMNYVVIINVLVDMSNALHQGLIDYTKGFLEGGEELDPFYNVKITSRDTATINRTTDTFVGYIDCESVVNLGNMAMLKITITR